MESFLSLLVGIGLSAACGFRVFVPLLVVSIASHTGHLHLSSRFEWMGATAAVIAVATATAEPIHSKPDERCKCPVCEAMLDRKSTRLNSSHGWISYAVFFLK